MQDIQNSRPLFRHPRIARLLLWPVLVLSVLGNAVASIVGARTTVSLGFGIVTALALAGLLATLRRRR